MHSNHAIHYTLETLDGGKRPETFMFDGAHRDEKVVMLKETLARIPWTLDGLADALNSFASQEPKMRFCEFRAGESSVDDDSIVLIGKRPASDAGVVMTICRDKQ